VPLISEETTNLLKTLGVLDAECRVTPEAYVGAIARKPVDVQANLLQLPIIIRPFRKNGGSPEKQFVTYFKSRVKAKIDGGESYSGEGFLIKSFISFIVPEFDHRKQKYDYSKEEIAEQTRHILSLDDWDIIKRCESFLDPNDMKFEYPSRCASDTPIDKFCLSKRFKDAKPRITSLWLSEKSDKERISEAKNKNRENKYVRFNLEQLELWHSLSKEEWRMLAEVTLLNWSKMYAGWPDLIFYSKETGLALVEIKGTDKIHASQVYTLLKLKEVLGPKRLAIGWLNSGRINYSGVIYSAHMKEAVEWFNTKWSERKPLTQKIYKK